MQFPRTTEKITAELQTRVLRERADYGLAFVHW